MFEKCWNERKLLYEQERPIVFVTFMGANMDVDDYDGKAEYAPRGEITINVAKIVAFYDHTIITQGNKIRVMELEKEIRKRICGR